MTPRQREKFHDRLREYLIVAAVLIIVMLSCSQERQLQGLTDGQKKAVVERWGK